MKSNHLSASIPSQSSLNRLEEDAPALIDYGQICAAFVDVKLHDCSYAGYSRAPVLSAWPHTLAVNKPARTSITPF